jgi:hypothetical protein|tara:strand:- start:1555 stop:1689 length:135 start_codon:yes stop_codon:yes gene_type:complete
MLKTVLVIILSVATFGILFFFYVKKTLKKRIDYYLKESKKNKEI